ncbi:MAG: lysophospholipase [Anaerolineales bacterium]|nr:lysophospholipase [Anaerolineales bacterium]
MEHFEKSFSSRDNLQLFVQGWEITNQKAVVYMVHGLGEHSGRYNHLASALNNAGYSLIAFDLRGHGHSQGQRGHSPSIDHILDDIDLFAGLVSERYPDTPRFLYGHSLGGMLAINHCIRSNPPLLGAVFSAPGLRSSLQDQKMKVFLSKMGGMLFPNVKLKSGLDPKALSHDAGVVKAYIDDPLVHDDISFGLARSMLEGISRVFDQASNITMPILVMHGSDDSLVFPSGSQDFCRLVKANCTLKIWDGLYHEIHNEFEKDMIFEYMIDWIDERSG